MRKRSKAEKMQIIEDARQLIGIPRPNADVLIALSCAYEMGYRSADILAWAARQMLDAQTS